ncbi:PTS fructose-like transporter subunit IIB [Thermocoleostomius sinensis]|uniref:PTS fructose-like transporter subunit IIB n=1 Tax=Thermocoleostomius sinensis A174 TaxID=2016057 RepID=A0A9E8ZLJ3_9CYAN|nr:PTS fructose-like transporter subunit IIB [Thermocoleostomius sinensis]WAL60716.1 PTS fructose-like transporter subunit IIB [Thermocoleostomius sinensis A174]
MTIHNIVAVTACPTGVAHTIMAAEALKKTAQVMGHELRVETQGSEGVKNALSDAEIAAADLVIVAADIHVDLDRFQGKPIHAVSTSRAIRDTRSVIEEAIARSRSVAPVDRSAPSKPIMAASTPSPTPTTSTVAPDLSATGSRYLVGITSCPTGIAHTFMAAEALRKGAAELGHDIKVETQGSVGAKNQLTPEDIDRADAVVIAADTHVDTARFVGKRLYQTSTKHALKDGAGVIQAALATPAPTATAGDRPDYLQSVQQAKAEQSAKRSGPYKHLLTGVSYMLPVIVAGGLIIALSFVFGLDPAEGTFGDALKQIGGDAAFSLIVPVLSGFIAFSIADRPGLAPGLIGGVLAANLGMGFLGGILSGFLAGYIALFVREKINLPANFEGLKPVLVIPLLSTLAVGLLLVYVFGVPVKAILDGLTAFLQNMGQTNAVILGLILGGMMAVDMGGPVNKAAYTFAVGLLATNIFEPMAAVMAAGMTPPLGLALATLMAKRKFTEEERQAGKVASVLGISFITEGAIPFAVKDPLRVIPSCIAGSAVAGGLSMLFGCTLRAPHGGVFVLAIPNAVGQGGLYIVAIALGSLVTAIVVTQLKRWQPSVQSTPEPTRASSAH